MQENQQLNDITLYKVAMGLKEHLEKTREEMNKYFTSLFTALLSAIPFVASFRPKHLMSILNRDVIWIFFVLVSIVGLVLGTSWLLALGRMYRHGEALNMFLVSIEQKNNQSFMGFVDDYLSRIHSPGMVAKNQMMVPYTFIFIFLLGLLYSVSMIVWGQVH